MWGSFTAWCLGRSPAVSLASLDVRDLQAFQAARFGLKSADLSLSPRHALRLLRLIDRVLRHHATAPGEPVNTAAGDWIDAQPEIRYAEAAQVDPLPEFLSVAEARHLITFLSNARPRPGLSDSRRDSHLAFTWQQLGNRVAVALQLGGGLAPGSVPSLHPHPGAAAGASGHGKWPFLAMATRRRARRRSPVGRASCCSIGLRYPQRLAFWATSFSRRPAAASLGARSRNTRPPSKSWKKQAWTLATAGRSGCGIPSHCDSCGAGQTPIRSLAGWASSQKPWANAAES